jgi:hypothetical protein
LKPDQEITLNSLSAICIIAQVYGFEPDTSWKLAAGIDSIFNDHEAWSWWEPRTIIRFRGFSSGARKRLANALSDFELDGGNRLRSATNPHAYDSRSLSIRELLPDRLHTALPKLRSFFEAESWRWEIDGREGVVLKEGEPAPDPTFTIPIPMPEEDSDLDFDQELTLAHEVKRLGRNPEEKERFMALQHVELTYREWRDILLTALAYHFRPVDPEWGRWERYYRLRNPTTYHSLFNAGFIRTKAFDLVDSEYFVKSLTAARDDELSQGESYFNQGEYGDDSITLAGAIKRVSSSLIERIIQLAPLWTYSWEVFNDGTVYVFARR